MKSFNTYLQVKAERVRSGDFNLEKHLSGKSPITSESFNPSIFNLRPAFTTAGDYEHVVRLPEPLTQFHKTVPGTVDEYKGKLREIFPELSKITREDLDNLSRKRDISE